MRVELKELKDRVENYVIQVASLTRTIKSMKAEIVRLQKENAALVDSVKAAEDSVQRLLDERFALRAKLNKVLELAIEGMPIGDYSHVADVVND